ncbi:MAG TPA: hypothetical protein DEV93_10050 [Chloroflexi bacterium]|jgi:hypothetical protein|nr:hypothetical protein [Chloroflexota bacterium]
MSDLTTQSTEWQHVLEQAEGKLIGEANDIVKDLQDIVSEAEGAAIAEAMCYTDFIRQRVFQTIVILLTAVVTKQSYSNIPVPKAPTVCVVTPTSVDPVRVANNSANTLQFWGYDFAGAPYRVFVDDATGGSTDVTGPKNAPNLAIETNYSMVLNMGSNGVQLPANAKDIRLQLNGDDVDTVPVVGENVPECVSQLVPIDVPGNVQVPGAHSQGDGDYWGHGPAVSATVSLDVRSDGLYARAGFSATETQSDWTSSVGTKDWFRIAIPLPGGTITQVEADPNTNYAYIHVNGNEDPIDVGGTKPVKQLVFNGFNGSKAADGTSMDISWQAIQVVELAPPSPYTSCVPLGGSGSSGGSPSPSPSPSPTPAPPSPKPTPPPNPCAALKQLRPAASATVIVKRFLGPSEALVRQCP